LLKSGGIDVSRVLDDSTLLLLYLDEHSCLTEFYMMFGLDGLNKLVDIFGGVTLNVPSREDLLCHIRDVDIWRRISDLDADPDASELRRSDLVQQLATRHNLTPAKVRSIVREVREHLAELNEQREAWAERLKTEITNRKRDKEDQ
jgi:hypothetical protein